jgi:holo-[acyl-carrier protein] synthase
VIAGLGTDIVEVRRLEHGHRRHGDRFLGRLFTPREIAYCQAQARPYPSYAARFAAKEAFLKALGSASRQGITWHHMEVLRDGTGPPRLVVVGPALAATRRRGVSSVLLSLSHTAEQAAAVVVLEREAPPSAGQQDLPEDAGVV